MPNRNRIDDERRRDDDREIYQSRQQGYPSGQMSQFDDSQGRDQMGWRSGEDYRSFGQMGGGSITDDTSHDTGRYARDPGDYQESRYARGSRQGVTGQGYRDRGEYVYGQSRYGSGEAYGPRDADVAGPSYVGHYSGIDSELDDRGYSAGYGQGSNWRSNNRNSSYERGDSRYRASFARGQHPRLDYAQSGKTSADDYHSWREYGESRGFLEKAGDEIASWFGNEDAARRREMDHRGRGPADYTRSDERIREDVNERLTHDRLIDASQISVTVKDGEVTLNGTVSHRRAKRRAEDLVDYLSGVKHVQNNLRMSQSTAAQATGSSQSGTPRNS